MYNKIQFGLISCAAIDFGTTFSGYAFQTKADFKEDPIRIQGFTWTTGSNAGLSNKTPTCVLFNPLKEFEILLLHKP
jgi:hypothetical protein